MVLFLKVANFAAAFTSKNEQDRTVNFRISVLPVRKLKVVRQYSRIDKKGDFFRELAWRAIPNFGLAFFYGCGASGLGTLIGAIHSPWLHYWFLHQGVPRGYVYEAIMMSLTVNWIAQGVNTACGLLGGYLLASRVSSHTLLLGAITGLPFMIHAALPYLTYPRPNPWWAQLLSFLLPIPVGMLGVWLGRRRALARLF